MGIQAGGFIRLWGLLPLFPKTSMIKRSPGVDRTLHPLKLAQCSQQLKKLGFLPQKSHKRRGCWGSGFLVSGSANPDTIRRALTAYIRASLGMCILSESSSKVCKNQSYLFLQERKPLLNRPLGSKSNEAGDWPRACG